MAEQWWGLPPLHGIPSRGKYRVPRRRYTVPPAARGREANSHGARHLGSNSPSPECRLQCACVKPAHHNTLRVRYPLVTERLYPLVSVGHHRETRCGRPCEANSLSPTSSSPTPSPARQLPPQSCTYNVHWLRLCDTARDVHALRSMQLSTERPGVFPCVCSAPLL